MLTHSQPFSSKVDNSVEDILQQVDASNPAIIGADGTIQKTRTTINSKDKTSDIKAGDSRRSQHRKGGKTETSFLGPYFIVTITDKSGDLEDDNGQSTETN